MRRVRSFVRGRGFQLALIAPQAIAVLFLILFAHPLAGFASALFSLHVTRAFRTGWNSYYSVTPKSARHLYLGLLPFFAWWMATAIFTVALPVSALAIALGAPARFVFATAGAGALALGLHSIRGMPRVRHVELSWPHLPEAFDGYRIAHLTDLHCGPFASERRVRRWVERTNRLGADLVALTGDLVASGTAYVDPLSRALARLSAPDGVVACMGNHDYFDAGEHLVAGLARADVRVLRNESMVLERERARLRIAGVDDTWSRRTDVARAVARRRRGEFTVLLAHDPDVFPGAAEHDIELTLAGHTHGGQLPVPWIARRYNLARLVTRFAAGVYREGRSLLYVSTGMGTTGPPVRLGARAEIALVTLRRSSAESA